MTLNFKRSVPKTNFNSTNILIHGFPKTGKTTLASKFKDGEKEPFFIMTEDGLGILDVPYERVKTWEEFMHVKQYLTLRKEEFNKKYSCIVIDLISDIDKFCIYHICKTKGVESINDIEWGRGWHYQQAQFQRAIGDLLQEFHVLFISHSVSKDITIHGEKVKTQIPDMRADNYNFLNGKVDLTGWIIPKWGKDDYPALTFAASVMCLAGSRFPWMQKQTFELNPSDMTGSYNNIIKIFNEGGLKNAGSKG